MPAGGAIHPIMDEISRWSAMDDGERASIMAELEGRKPLVVKRRGGRAARLKRA
ncbi:DUF1289 domain-containing protein [Profundibacter sp.]|uniref:DUF1289 domain-containing protein n=1 Tax=Profundibacter sp. TaxID=3101071 RepID=UPI003D09CC86